ncbi:MAG: 30S ribosome-binding factor RbfA [Clostridia bacterium]|nr:30S ribosome-binding factor RbfA [Clostridia bacterium]
MRILKINSEIEKAISEILTYELKNPAITGIISVTKVDTTNDLEYCKVYVSIFTPGGDKEEVFNQIKHSAGFIRRELCKKVQLRKVPFLTFYLDDSYTYGEKIEDKIEEIQKSRKENENGNQ